MENCLFTKERGTVSGDLPKFKEVEFKFKDVVESSTVTLDCDGTIHLTTDGTFAGDVHEVDVTNSFNQRIYNASKLIIDDKYKLTTVNLSTTRRLDNFDLKNLAYSDLETLVIRTNSVVDTSIIHNWPHIIDITLPFNPNFTGSTDDFGTHVNKNNISGINISESNITGGLEVFLDMQNLKALRVSNCSGIYANRSTITTLTSRLAAFQYAGIRIIEDA